MEEERSKPEIIQSVAVGDKREFVLSEVNEKAFRTRASELNDKARKKAQEEKAEHFTFYSIATNTAMNTLMIIAKTKKTPPEQETIEDESGD